MILIINSMTKKEPDFPTELQTLHQKAKQPDPSEASGWQWLGGWHGI